MPIVQTTNENGETVELEVEPDAIEYREDEDPTDLPGVQDEINRVAGKTRQKAKKTAKKELRGDDDFWKKEAQRRGVELREDDLQPKGASSGEVKELKKENAKLRERAEKADEYESELEQIRDTRLENEILQSVEGVKADLKDVFLDAAKSRFEYDEDDEQFVPVEDGSRVYGKGVEDVVEEMREERPSMFQDTEVSGGSSAEPGGSTSTGKRTWSEDEHASADPLDMDPQTFEDWKTAAEEGRIE